MLVALALAMNLVFPNLQVHSLAGPSLETRQQQGTPVVYLIGFTHESRPETAAWRQAISAATGGTLRAIEMPVLSGLAVAMRPIIEGSMARKTPEAERADIQTTTDRETLVAGLRLADPDRAAVLALVDAQGVVRYMARGGPTPETEAALRATWEQLQRGR